MTVSSVKRKLSTSETPESDTVGIRYSCDYCYKDISNIVRIQCGECGLSYSPSETNSSDTAIKPYSNCAQLEEVDLCVECFAAGVEFGNHKKNHPYRILKPLNFAIFAEDWRADEEILLLESVESNGIGNWHDVAEQIGTRTSEECKQHYTDFYLLREPKILPKDIIEKSRENLRTFVNKKPRLSGSDEAIALHPTPQSIPANHEIAGYMPLRGEFETETENDAEVAIKDIQFTEEDTEAERQLKFTMLDIYTGALERRAARRSFIFSHGLVDFKRHQSVDKLRSKEEREIYNMLKPFARFISVNDFQKLLDGLTREEELRRQIANLQELRKNGIRSFSEVPLYENEKKHLELFLKGGTIPMSSSQNTNTSKVNVPVKEPHPIPIFTKAKTTSLSSNVASLPPISIPKAVVLTDTTQPPKSITPQANSVSSATTPVSATNITVVPASSGGRKASTPLNISHAEGVELLSEKERHLCSILRLYPRLYLNIKDTLIREYLKYGGLKRAQARAAVKIDVNKTSKLYDFFVAAGWIKPPASGE